MWPEFVETRRVSRNTQHPHKCQGQIQPRLETYDFKKAEEKGEEEEEEGKQMCETLSPDRM